MNKISYKTGLRNSTIFTVIVIHNLQTNLAMNASAPPSSTAYGTQGHPHLTPKHGPWGAGREHTGLFPGREEAH